MTIISLDYHNRAKAQVTAVEMDKMLREIVITSIDNAVGTREFPTSITVLVDEVITVNGTVEIPDSPFVISLSKNGAVEEMFPAMVVDQKFSVKIAFSSTGQYKFTSENANLDLPQQIFKVTPITIDVLRDLSSTVL